MGGKCLKNRRKGTDNMNSLLQEKILEKINKNFNDNHKFYFKIIQEKLKKFYFENRTSQMNISISLDKKDFCSFASAKKISVQSSQEIIHWKDYLINFLNKRTKKGVKWCEQLKTLVENESILNENKFLSLFFWQEYEIKAKTIGKHAKSTTILDKATLIKPNESFCSINTSNMSENDPTHEYKEYKSRAKMYISIFKEHIFNTEHPINVIVRHFIRVYSEYLQENIKLLLNSRNNNDFCNLVENNTKDITKNLQKFIIKIQTCFRLMYCKTANYQCFIEERDEFINFITSFIFKDNRIFDNIYKLYEICLEDQISQLSTKLRNLMNINPLDLGIHEKFALNESTRRFQNKMIKIYEEKNKNYELNNFLNSNNEKTKKKELEIEENQENTSNFTELTINNKNDHGIPYNKAIEYLNQIKLTNSPFEKMLIIANISGEITSCINEYWKNKDKFITKSLLNIDADELMSIFIFIIIKSQLSELLIHTKIIKDFTTCVTKNTMIGYYTVTLDASIMYILDLKDKNLLKNTKEVLKKSFLPDKKSFLGQDTDTTISIKNYY